MRLIPHQTERQAFALMLLACLALLMPSFWIACHGVCEPVFSEIIPLLFVSVLLTIGAIAGTRRIAWLAILAPVACLPILYWCSTFVYEGTGAWSNFKPNIFEQLNPNDEARFLKLINQIGMAYAAVATIAYAASFVFDRLLGRVGFKNESVDFDGEAAGQNDSAPIQTDDGNVTLPKNSHGKVKTLIIFAVLLFAIQIVVRVASSQFGASKFFSTVPAVKTLALPIGVLLVFVLPAAFACRLRTLFSPFLGTALIGMGTVAFSLQKGIAPSSLPFPHAGIVRFGVVLALAFFTMAILLGTSNRKASRSVSWLSLLGMTLFVSTLLSIRTLDLPTLVMGGKPFNLPVAKQVNAFHFSPFVKAYASVVNANHMIVQIQFRSDVDPDSLENFFDEKRQPTPLFSHSYSMQNMPETVDLSSLRTTAIRFIELTDCTLCPEQLSVLSGASWSSFDNCTLSTANTKKTFPAATNNSIVNAQPGEIANLLGCLSAQNGRTLHLRSGAEFTNRDDHEAILNWLERGGALYLQTSSRWNSQMFDVFPADMDLSGVTISAKPVRSFDELIQRDVLKLILQRNVCVNVSLPVPEEQWKLVVAIPGKFIGGINYESMMNSMPPKVSLRDVGLEWSDKSGDAQYRKLYFPHCYERTFRFAVEHTKLEALSFDEAWLQHDIPATILPVQHELDASRLANLTELKELYFSRFADVTDLRVLKPLSDLETLQVSTQSTGFSATLFPKLKHIRLYSDTQPSARLLKELARIKQLESVVILDTAEAISQEKLDVAVKEHFDSNASIVLQMADTAMHELVPESFKQHQERFRAKILKELEQVVE